VFSKHERLTETDVTNESIYEHNARDPDCQTYTFVNSTSIYCSIILKGKHITTNQKNQTKLMLTICHDAFTQQFVVVTRGAVK